MNKNQRRSVSRTKTGQKPAKPVKPNKVTLYSVTATTTAMKP